MANQADGHPAAGGGLELNVNRTSKNSKMCLNKYCNRDKLLDKF